jgi:hypothetical protein
MVELYKLLCVAAIVETVGNSCGRVGVIVVGYTVIDCSTIVNNLDMPEAMMLVTPPMEDDRAIVSYFASSGMEDNFTSSTKLTGNR